MPESIPKPLAVRRPSALSLDLIVEEAARQFATGGYDATTLEAIARPLGVTKPALYYYVRSKKQLLAIIFERLSTYVLGRLKTITAAALPWDERLGNVVRFLVELSTSHQDDLKIYYREQPNLSRILAEEARAVNRKFLEHVVVLIEEGMALGQVPPGAAGVKAMGIMGLGIWTHRWVRPNGTLTADEIGNVLAEQALWGLRAEKPNPDR